MILTTFTLWFCHCLFFFTDCTVPDHPNAKAKGESKTDIITGPVSHGTIVNYYCDSGYSPKEAQSFECGSPTAGQIEISGIEKCNEGTFEFE